MLSLKLVRHTHHTKNVINANGPAENIITSVFSIPVEKNLINSNRNIDLFHLKS